MPARSILARRACRLLLLLLLYCLQELYIDHNRLTTLPLSLSRLKNLRRL